jgi:hypothetical protein
MMRKLYRRQAGAAKPATLAIREAAALVEIMAAG